VLSACAGFVPQVGPDPEPPTSFRYVTLTTPIIAVGDTQEHLSTGYRCTTTTARWTPMSK